MPKNILTPLADNEELLEAVKQVFLNQFSFDGLKSDMSNELLGQWTRAVLLNRKGVENACKEISKYASVPQSTSKENPAY